MRHIFLVLAMTGPALAEDAGFSAEVLALEGDRAFGEYLSGECVGCHVSGGAEGAIPAIAGRARADFVGAILEYRDGLRDHAAMQTLAGRLSAEELAALAAFYEAAGE